MLADDRMMMYDFSIGKRYSEQTNPPGPIRLVMRTIGAWQYRRYITRPMLGVLEGERA